MDTSTSSIMPLLQNRGRCVSLEENLDVFLAASDAPTEEQDGSVLGKGDTLSYFSSLYRPRRSSVSGSSHEHAATAAEDEVMSSINKRQPSSLVLDEEDEIKMAPPKKMAKKKNQTRITEFYGEGVDDTDYIIHPTHLLFNQYPKAPKRFLGLSVGCFAPLWDAPTHLSTTMGCASTTEEIVPSTLSICSQPTKHNTISSSCLLIKLTALSSDKLNNKDTFL